MKHRIYVVGMGPGQENMMTQEALQVLEASDVIIGYTVYLKLLGERFGCKELLSTLRLNRWKFVGFRYFWKLCWV